MSIDNGLKYTLESEGVLQLAQSEKELTPYRCPICGGNGFVPGGFYNKVGDCWVSDKTAETCRACGGTGIIWG